MVSFVNTIDQSFERKMSDNEISARHVDYTQRKDWLKTNEFEHVNHEALFQNMEPNEVHK